MKLVCAYGNVVEEGSYWCKNCSNNCPPARLSLVFEHGEMIDDLEIVDLLKVFPSSVLYRAKRGKEVVFVKVAHQGFEEQLKKESLLLSNLEPHPALPVLLSASNVERRPYGKFTLREQVKYYLVLKNAPGVFLRNMLNHNPQPLPRTAAWLIVSLADAVAYLQVKGRKLLTNPTPDNILVYEDKSGIWRPLLLDLGATTDIGARPVKTFGVPVYAAPEQAEDAVCTVVTDVYRLGAILYEMLAGEPIFPAKLASDEEIRSLILRSEPVSLRQKRPELVTGVADVVHQALQKNPAHRQPDIRTFAKGLRVLFGEVPPEPRRWQIDRRVIAAIAFSTLAALLVLVILLLVEN
jgi:serine/threonine protein kinase